MRVFRVVTDEPQGVAVGFDPREFREVEVDEFELVSDDGGDLVVIDGLNHLSIRQEAAAHEPDLLVWRSPGDFEEWFDEMQDLDEDEG